MLNRISRVGKWRITLRPNSPAAPRRFVRPEHESRHLACVGLPLLDGIKWADIESGNRVIRFVEDVDGMARLGEDLSPAVPAVGRGKVQVGGQSHAGHHDDWQLSPSLILRRDQVMNGCLFDDLGLLAAAEASASGLHLDLATTNEHDPHLRQHERFAVARAVGPYASTGTQADCQQNGRDGSELCMVESLRILVNAPRFQTESPAKR